MVDLVASMKELTNAFTQYGKDFERKSLALGLNFEQASQRLGKGFDQLHGDISDRMAVGLESLQAGLMTTDGGLSQLISQQKLTGQQWQQTAAIWTNVVAAGVASEEAMKVLAENTIALGDTYTVQTSLLTGVIKSLERSMVDMGLADMGPQVLGAITELQATMGPQQKANFEKINQMIFDTSVEGYQKLALLNIPNIREQLSAARTQGEAASLLMSAIKTAGMTIDDFTSDADQAFIRLGQAGQIFGESAKLFSPVAKALAEDARKSAEERTAFWQQWDIMFKDVIAPLEVIFKSVIFSNLRNLTIAITDFGKVLVEKIKGLIDGFGGTDGLTITVDTFKTVILDSADKIIDAVEMIPSLFSYLFGSDGFLIKTFDAFSHRLTTKANAIWLDMKIDHLIPMWGDIRKGFMELMQSLKTSWDVLNDPARWDESSFANALTDGVIRLVASSAGVLGTGALRGLLSENLEREPTQGEMDMLLTQRRANALTIAQMEESVAEKAAMQTLAAQISAGTAQDPGSWPGWAHVYVDKVTAANRLVAELRDINSDTANQVAQINDKIPDPNDGGLLAESAFILGDAIERVLGFDKGPQGMDLWEEMVELQREIAEREIAIGIAQDSISTG